MNAKPNDDQATDTTPLDELNEDGVGGTLGADNTFEPEEDEDAPVQTPEA